MTDYLGAVEYYCMGWRVKVCAPQETFGCSSVFERVGMIAVEGKCEAHILQYLQKASEEDEGFEGEKCGGSAGVNEDRALLPIRMARKGTTDLREDPDAFVGYEPRESQAL